MIFLNNLFGGGPGSGGGDIVDYVNGNITVTLPTTEFIHGDTFNTSGAEVIYTAPDGTETDVTSAASFSPSNGSTLNIDGQNTVRVSYTPSGKSTIYTTAIITVAPIPESLTIILHDSGMRVNESISYKGAIVKALMSDRTEKDVSGETLVWSPLEGTVQDNDGTITVHCSYTENGETATGTAEMVVTDRILTGITMELGKTQYYYGDNLDTTNTVVTARYDDNTTASVKSKCEFTPENRTELTTHGTQSVVCSYTENSITKRATGTINVRPKPTGLSISFTDPGFKTGDRLSYANAKVTCTWSDGHTTDVSNSVTWDPVAGETLDRSGKQTVRATYEYDGFSLQASSSVNVTDLQIISIGADFSTKNYREGDSLNLSGLHVTAMYENGTTQDVTQNASTSPHDGATLKKSDTKVTVSYSENGKKLTYDVGISVAYVTGISISGLVTDWDANESIDYEGVTVTAAYSDGYSADVTDSVSWSPSNGSKLATTDHTVKATYRDNSSNSHTASQAISVRDIPTKLDVDLSVTDYEVGDSLDTSGSSIVVTYASGRTASKTPSDVTWEPAGGTKLNKEGTQYITVSYTEG